MQKLLLIFYLTLLALSANAQGKFFELVIHGGPSIASLRGNTFIDSLHSSRVGFTAGMTGQYNFSNKIGLLTGAYYELKGSSFELTITNMNGNALGMMGGKENFHFITIPLLLRMEWRNKLKYFVNTGPYIGILLKQTEFTESFHYLIEQNVSDRTDYFQNTETGISVGLGIKYFRNDNLGISAEVRNNLGLTDLSDTPVYNNGEIKSNALSLLLGFNYRFGKREYDEIFK